MKIIGVLLAVLVLLLMGFELIAKVIISIALFFAMLPVILVAAVIAIGIVGCIYSNDRNKYN